MGPSCVSDGDGRSMASLFPCVHTGYIKQEWGETSVYKHLNCTWFITRLWSLNFVPLHFSLEPGLKDKHFLQTCGSKTKMILFNKNLALTAWQQLPLAPFPSSCVNKATCPTRHKVMSYMQYVYMKHKWLGWAWVSPTLLRLHCNDACVCPYTANLNISQSLNVVVCLVGEGYCYSVVSMTWSEDGWRWSIYGNLFVVCDWQLTHEIGFTKFGRESGWQQWPFIRL